MAGIQKEIIAGKKSYVVGGLPFPRKQDVTDAVRKILYQYRPGEIVGILHHDFLLSLLGFHKHCKQKIGGGVLAFTVETNPLFPSQTGFWITRLDGSRTDFSFVECISPAPAIRCLKSAMRQEIAAQVIAAKNAVFDKSPRCACPISGDSLSRDNCHVDHEPPDTFDVIADRFIAAMDINPETIEMTGGDGVVGEEFVDRALALAWSDFHARHAKLRMVSALANLSDIKVGFNREARNARN
jgi:hypothetical protein